MSTNQQDILYRVDHFVEQLESEGIDHEEIIDAMLEYITILVDIDESV